MPHLYSGALHARPGGAPVTKRGAKSHTTIAGHTLTWAELTVLRQLQEYLATLRPTDSVLLRNIFPGTEFGPNAKRYCVRKLSEVGVLMACGIELLADDVVKLKG